MEKNRLIGWIAGGALLTALVLYCLLAGFGGPRPSLPWETLTLQAEERPVALKAAGQLAHAALTPVYAQGDGRVAQTYVQTGSLLQAGDVLAFLQNEALERELQDAADTLQSLRVSLATAARDLPPEVVDSPASGLVLHMTGRPGDALADGVTAVIAAGGAFRADFPISGWEAADWVPLRADGLLLEGQALSYEEGILSVRVTGAILAHGQKAELLDAQGLCLAQGEIRIESPCMVWGVAGIIDAVHAQPGDWVEAGAPLFTLTAPLTAPGLETQLLAYEQAQRRLNALRRMAEGLTLLAPTEGLLLDFSLAPGQTLSAGDAVATLADPTLRQARLSISEEEVGAVLPGMDVRLHFPALPGQAFQGLVESIAPDGRPGPGGSAYEVTVTLPYAEGMLPGMSVQGEILTGGRISRCLVPQEALYWLEDQPYLLRAPDPSQIPGAWLQGPLGRALRPDARETLALLLDGLLLPVGLGETQDGRVEILQGAGPGDVVVLWNSPERPS